MRIKYYTRYLRQNPLATLLIFGSLFVVTLNESIVYYLKSLQWDRLHCITDDCTRILLVADPQILGETFDKNLYNPIAVRDSDRYLRKTFRLAVSHAKPDVIVFMGDLMDEGSVAKTDEFQRYVSRFKDVFHVPNGDISLMHISGDNDVGGESEDSVTDDKVNRFKDAFNEQGHIDVKKRLRIFNINQFTHYYPNVTKQDTPSTYYRVVVTHLSLLSYPGRSTEKVGHEIQPSVIFSAHQHVSRIITYPPIHVKHFNQNTPSPISFNLREIQGSNHLEIMVPTCSYRMGSKEIGYGFGTIENNRLQYTVLWLPNRFIYLYVYLAWLSICILLSVAYYIGRKCWCYRNNRGKLTIHHIT